MNKYEKWYNDITLRGQSRKLDGYAECHHIIPESIGGPDTTENKTMLTAREHFVCHWLLTKIYTSGKYRHQVLKALWMMRAENPNQERYGTTITSRVYANLKEEYSILQSKKVSGKGNGMYGKQHTEEAKRRISEANAGRKQTAEEKQKQIDAMTGRKRAPFSEEWINNIKEAHSGENNGMYGKKHTDEARAKQSARATGRRQSAETVQKKADAIRGTKREKLLCPHCQQLIAVNTYPRWHGENCRELTK
jgi:NUMOD3 motif